MSEALIVDCWAEGPFRTFMNSRDIPLKTIATMTEPDFDEEEDKTKNDN